MADSGSGDGSGGSGGDKGGSGGDINSVDAGKLDPRVLATLVGKPVGMCVDLFGFLAWNCDGMGLGYSMDYSHSKIYANKPAYGGWSVHDTASSAHKNLADAMDKTVADLTSSLNTLMENWQGTPVPKLKSTMEGFISSVQTLAHSVRTASDVHHRQSGFFSDLYSWGGDNIMGINFSPGWGNEQSTWRMLPSAHEMNDLHTVYAGGQWYNWLNPAKWALAAAARIYWNNYSGHAHKAYSLYVGDSAGNAAPNSFGSVPQIPKLTSGSGGGSGGGSGAGGGALGSQLASLLPSLLLAPMSMMGMLSGLAGGLGKGATGAGNSLASAPGLSSDAASDIPGSDSPSSGLVGSRVPNRSGLPDASRGFRFPPGWDGKPTPVSSSPANAELASDRATAQRPSGNANSAQGGGMPGMMPPMMGNRGAGGGGQGNSSSRSALQKETAPIFVSDKGEPFTDDEWSSIIPSLAGAPSNIELANPHMEAYMQQRG